VRDIQAAARGAGLVWRTIERAKARLGVQAFLLGYGAAGRWQWRLPEADRAHHQTPETDTLYPLSVSEEDAEKLAQTVRDRHSTSDLSVSGPAIAETGDVPRERVRF
jgi:hypothetical protein